MWVSALNRHLGFSLVENISYYRVLHKSLSGFVRSYIRNLWDYRNVIGAKRCVSTLSFVWKFENVDYLNILLSYDRIMKNCVFGVFGTLQHRYL